MRPALALLLVLGLLAGACSGAEDLSESSAEFEADAPDATAPAPEDPAPEDPAGEDPTGEDPAGEASTADDLRIVELEVDNSGEVVVDVASDEVSLLLVARGQGLDDEVFVDAIIAPDGTLVDAPLELQPSNVGDTAVLLPLFADGPLQPGEGTFVVDSDAGAESAQAVLNRGPLATDQVVDVTFHVASFAFADASQAEREELAIVYRNAGDTILGIHGLAVGDLAFVDADPAVTEAFADIELPSSGNDAAQRELCSALDTGDGPSRRLAFAIVDRVVDPDDTEGETEGNAAGLPGATILPGLSTSCVLMIADGSRDVTDLAATVWHEAGHLMGLPHTTESEGDAFDTFDDTPECEAEAFDGSLGDGADGFVDAEECPDGDNLMFHDSDALAISEQQAFVLRHHPLFRPAP